MTLFWSLALALTLLALMFVLVPLLRVRPAAVGDRVRTETAQTAVGISVYRRQLTELEADHAAGSVSPNDYQAARLDLQRSLLEMAPTAAVPRNGGPVRSQRWPAGIATLLLLPLLASGLYVHFGGGPDALVPTVPDVDETVAMDPATAVATALSALHERLEDNPQDPIGWALLGRLYLALGRMPAAAQAYAQALAVGGDQDAEILVDYADLLATMRAGNLEGRPRDLLQRALRLEPDHPKGLWLAGTAAFRAGDYGAAQDYWTQLLAQLTPQSETWTMIQGNLAEVALRRGVQP